MERITELSAPPIVGQFYLVPTVHWQWRHFSPRWWPVFLPLHEDARFFRFTAEHYHVDPRFVPGRTHGAFSWWADDPWRAFQATPIARHRTGDWAIEPGPVVWRRRRCGRNRVPYVLFGKVKAPGMGPEAICRHWEGQTAPRNRFGWVCPHQHAALGSIGPERDGVITCPLHGLRLRAADGVVLGPPA